MLSWTVLTKLKWTRDQINKSVFVLTVGWLWKLCRLPKCPHQCNSAKGIKWHFHPQFCGTLLGPHTFWDMWNWNCQWAHKEADCSNSLLDWNLPWGNLGRLQERYKAGLTTSIWQCGKVLAVLTDRLENWSWDPVLLLTSQLSSDRIQSGIVTGLLTGQNTLRSHIYLMGLSESLICRRCGAEKETAQIGTSGKAWQHSDVPICVPFSWTMRILEV